MYMIWIMDDIHGISLSSHYYISIYHIDWDSLSWPQDFPFNGGMIISYWNTESKGRVSM